MEELDPIITLLSQDKLSDEGVENLCKSLNTEAVIELIKGVNEQEKFWWTEVRRSNVRTGRGNRNRASFTHIVWRPDHNKPGVWPRAFLYFLLCILRLKPEFVLDLPMPLATSSKYFALVTCKDTERVILLKFRKEHLSSTMFSAFTTLLYSRRNYFKRWRFKLPVLVPLDNKQWD